MQSDDPQSGRTALLFFGHALFPDFIDRIAAARRDFAGRVDVHVVAYFPEGSTPPAAFRDDPSFHAYGPDRMAALSYPAKGGAPFRLIPGNCDMPVIAFARAHLEYETFWLLESDAVFTGPLPGLTDAFARSDSALLCTNLGRVSPHWHFHGLTRIPGNWPPLGPEVIRGFLPVFRVSRALLEALDRFYRDGGAGHHEVTWPYVACALGLPMEDIGGSGPYVRPSNRNRFYTSSPRAQAMYPGTFRWRPAMPRPGRRPLTLWHPVKERREPLHWYLRQRYRLLARWRWFLKDPDRI